MSVFGIIWADSPADYGIDEADRDQNNCENNLDEVIPSWGVQEGESEHNHEETAGSFGV